MGTTDNSLSAFNPEIWADDIQTVYFRENVAYSLADMNMDGLAKYGDTLNKPYAAPITDEAYVRGTAISIDGQTPTNESLSVATMRALGGYYDDIRKICVFA